MEKDPFAEGVDAFHSGLAETQNPYDLDEFEDAHMSWNDGWMSAADMDKEEAE